MRRGYQLAALGGLVLAGLALASGQTDAAEPAGPANPREPQVPPVGPQPPPAVLPTPEPTTAQKGIVDAVWASAKGDPTPLAQIARELAQFPGPLKAYIVAATRDGLRIYKDNAAWVRDFNERQASADKGRAGERASGEKVAGAAAGVVAAVGIAAAAANAVPVVGQVVSAALALGLAIAVALTEGEKLPVRRGEDQIRDAYEGVSVFYGLSWAPVSADDLETTLKRAVIQDPVAFALPAVPLRTPFPFAPSLQTFREAAHELKLYAGES